MRLADVVGHERAKAQLARAVATGRVPSAVCLLGPPGVGKRALADALAALLVCTAPTGDDACGQCAACSRLVAGTHPDVRVVEREEERRDIRVEQVRDLMRWLSLQSMTAPRKVAIIDDAHHLNEHAQNALLKTLEEPPGGAVLVLIAPAAALLRPTVRSRCRIVRLGPLAADEVARVLAARGVASDRAEGIAALAEGSPGRALALAGDDAGMTRDGLLTALRELAERPALKVSQLAQALSTGATEAALGAAVAWYRELLQTTLAGDALPLRYPAAAETIRDHAARLPPAARLRQLEAVCDTLAALDRNANRMLALETLLLVLRDIERGRQLSWTHTR